MVISIDLNIRLGASADSQAYLRGVWSLLPLADIVKASDEDLMPFRLSKDPHCAARLAHVEMGSGLLILTTGGGARLHMEDKCVDRAAYPVSKMGDTVGAGDTFQAAFLASLFRAGAIENTPLKIDSATAGDAIDFACAAAAINVSRVGCSPPSFDEVNEFRTASQR